jgi:hypothetical protein
MTVPSLVTLLSTVCVLLILSSVDSFGRRGSEATDIGSKSAAKNQHSHWSSTGSKGFGRDTPQDAKKVEEVNIVAKPTTAKALQDIDHPDRAFLEHHPYASGVFAIDSTVGIVFI